MLKLQEPHETPPMWILSNPRVGSSYLASFLNCIKRTACLRFNLFLPPFQEYYLDPDQATRPLPYYNKIHVHHFHKYLSNTVLEDCLPGIRYVRLVRRDYAAVAVSHFLARKLSQFVIQRCQKDQLRVDHVDYDYKEILDLDQQAKDWDGFWDSYLVAREHLFLEYEELVDDPAATIDRVMKFSGHSGKYWVNWDSVFIMTKMEHPQKREFIERFRSDYEVFH